MDQLGLLIGFHLMMLMQGLRVRNASKCRSALERARCGSSATIMISPQHMKVKWEEKMALTYAHDRNAYVMTAAL